MKNGISLNIIVKNESQNIDEAIQSAMSLSNEVIVIDTGSSDNTAQICSKYGVYLFHHKWNDDFSEIRNIAIKYSSYNWILSLDADEIVNFSKDDIPKEILYDEEYGGINLILKNFLGDNQNQGASKHRYTRLFRNDERIRYKGRIHEQIRESIENSDFKIFESNLEILHKGYANIQNDKVERNIDLLKKDLRDNPEDEWLKFHLAESYFALGKKDEAYSEYQKIINSPQLTDIQNDKVKIRLAQIYLTKDDYSQIITMLDFVSDDSDLDGLRKFVLAAAYLSSHDVKTALSLYNDETVKNSSLVDKSQLSLAVQTAEKIKEVLG